MRVVFLRMFHRLQITKLILEYGEGIENCHYSFMTIKVYNMLSQFIDKKINGGAL